MVEAVFGHSSFFAFVFGFPVVYAIVALVGYPILQERPGSSLLAGSLAVGTATGAIVMGVFGRLFGGSLSTIPAWMLIGALCGAAGGIAFWSVTK
jgi:hypothetical protein